MCSSVMSSNPSASHTPFGPADLHGHLRIMYNHVHTYIAILLKRITGYFSYTSKVLASKANKYLNPSKSVKAEQQPRTQITEIESVLLKGQQRFMYGSRPSPAHGGFSNVC